ncbi:hypothetical protein EKO04_007557 [Ascochyta lentis]|uniref:F-box domain-containing protein n=1 Tax=Ascochyta lentis TaxID=205686 RepID=A0A8H7MCI1_9PLEO|nr:hypothetical protein EKO04_007557 [Ascochyta lentis]
MNFVLPLRPSRSAKPSNTIKASSSSKSLQPPPPESPRRRPSLATRAGVVKRRSSVATTFNAPSMSLLEAMFGDDFPDAFANGDGRSCKSRKTMLDLPAEILGAICQPLTKADIKRLRLTCRELAEKVELRIDRVYISPNRANLDNLNNILNHPRHCLQVQEIVWDDAQLIEYPTIQSFRAALTSDDREAEIILELHVKALFEAGGNNNTAFRSIGLQDFIKHEGGLTELAKAALFNSNDTVSRDYIASNATTTMSVEESYDLYQKLYQDEKEIIKRGWDVNGLQRALTHIPNLKRITLTSEVWRSRRCRPIPTYDPPFFRALPPGFRKPSPPPWGEPGSDFEWQDQKIAHELDQLSTEQHLPVQWRGYSIIMSCLMTNPAPTLEEFVVDAGDNGSGLPCHLFTSKNLDYSNTIRALSNMQLKRLQLPLVTFTGLVPVGHLYDLIVTMPHLEHLDLMWNTSPPITADFPDHTCRTLKSITLHLSVVDCRWLLDLIKRSEDLQTVTLDAVQIGVWRDPFTGRESLFLPLREYFSMVKRRGPTFTWIDSPLCGRAYDGRWRMLDNELNAFLYNGAEWPWPKDGTVHSFAERCAIKPGFGWTVDVRDPEFRQKRLRP